jgi:hypothetical protein
LSAHRFCARFAKWRQDQRGDLPADSAIRYPLFVSTNYDDLLEQAYNGLKFDLLYYDKPSLRLRGEKLQIGKSKGPDYSRMRSGSGPLIAHSDRAITNKSSAEPSR